jgi:hypothetical protein
MLKILSYLNIALALTYFVAFLMNSYSWPIAAILFVILYNGLVLNRIEKELKFTFIHYLLGGLCLVFAGFLTVWLVHIIQSSISHNYFRNTWFYILLSSLFITSILLQYIVIIWMRSGAIEPE